MTPLAAWRTRRNLVLVLAAEQGVSERMLADVFDLDPAAVHRIIKSYHRKVSARIV